GHAALPERVAGHGRTGDRRVRRAGPARPADPRGARAAVRAGGGGRPAGRGRRDPPHPRPAGRAQTVPLGGGRSPRRRRPRDGLRRPHPRGVRPSPRLRRDAGAEAVNARVAVTAAVLAIGLAGCSGPSDGPVPPPVRPAPAAPAGPVATLGEPEELTSGLEAPWGLTFLPDGSALVSERISGEIERVPAGGGPARTVGVVPDVDVSSEGGLLGIVASPEFATDRLVYAAVSGRDQNRIVALTFAEDFGWLAVDRVLLDGIQTADRHHGGRIVVGPDGHLWIGT